MRAAAFALALALAATGCAGAATSPPSVTGLPAPGDTLLGAARLGALPAPARQAWLDYLKASDDARARDRAAVDAELRAAGRSAWTPAPHADDFAVSAAMTGAWFATDEAGRIADVIVSFQTPSGGWSKAVDVTTRPRLPGEGFGSTDSWSWIGTFDNGATTEELRFLGAAARARADGRHAAAFLRGLDYIALAQFPNGCWPQSFPLDGGYHDAATFNDDAAVRVLRLLTAVARGDYAFVPADARGRAAAGVARGVSCIVASQVKVGGRLTAWGQQHDPLGLAPVKARAFEPASLASRESAGILEILMGLESPDAATVAAVHAAAAWLRATAIGGYAYESGALVPRAGAGPLWARLYEIGTDRPVFGDRDGSVHYELREISEERRLGYAWYVTSPAATLRRYDTWAAAH